MEPSTLDPRVLTRSSAGPYGTPFQLTAGDIAGDLTVVRVLEGGRAVLRCDCGNYVLRKERVVVHTVRRGWTPTCRPCRNRLQDTFNRIRWKEQWEEVGTLWTHEQIAEMVEDVLDRLQEEIAPSTEDDREFVQHCLVRAIGWETPSALSDVKAKAVSVKAVKHRLKEEVGPTAVPLRPWTEDDRPGPILDGLDDLALARMDKARSRSARPCLEDNVRRIKVERLARLPAEWRGSPEGPARETMCLRALDLLGGYATCGTIANALNTAYESAAEHMMRLHDVGQIWWPSYTAIGSAMLWGGVEAVREVWNDPGWKGGWERAKAIMFPYGLPFQAEAEARWTTRAPAWLLCGGPGGR